MLPEHSDALVPFNTARQQRGAFWSTPSIAVVACAATAAFALGVLCGRGTVPVAAAAAMHGRGLQSTASDSCAPPCFLPSQSNLALLCGGTSGSSASTDTNATSATAAAPAAAQQVEDTSVSSEAAADTPDDADAKADGADAAAAAPTAAASEPLPSPSPSPTASPAPDGSSDAGGEVDAATVVDIVAEQNAAAGFGFEVSEGDLIPLVVLAMLLFGVPFIITVGMVYFFCIKKP